MNYKNQYKLLINKAKNRFILEGYKEKHHIQPKCMGGTDDGFNLVNLTAREHYLAHWLLHKIFPKNNKLLFSLNMIMHVKHKERKLKISSKEYEKVRILHSKAMREVHKGKSLSLSHRQNISKGNMGRIMSLEVRKKISKSQMGEKNHMYGRKGKDNPNTGLKRTPEQIRRQSEIQKGKHTGKDNGFYGHTHTKKQKDLWSIKRKGYKHREEDKQKISDIQKGKSRKWLYKVISPDGIVVNNYEPVSLVSICEKYEFNFKTFISYTIYKNRDYKGWTAFRKLNNCK